MDIHERIRKMSDLVNEAHKGVNYSSPASQAQAHMAGLQVEATLVLAQTNLMVAEAILELKKR